MAYGIIYLLIDATNDKEYVGQTTKTLKKRFNQHKRGDQLIDRTIQKRGEDMFTTAILKECASKAELDFWERHMIRSRDTKCPNGYNLTEGGDGVGGLKHTPEHNAKIAAVLTGKKRPLEFVVKFSAIRRFYSPYKNLICEIGTHNLTYTALKKRLSLANISKKCVASGISLRKMLPNSLNFSACRLNICLNAKTVFQLHYQRRKNLQTGLRRNAKKACTKI